MKNILYFLFIFALGLSVNAMDVSESVHKEETKTQLSMIINNEFQTKMETLEIKTVSFNDATKALKEGKRVTNKKWENGLFIFMQVPADIPIKTVANMQSLPEQVKQEFIKRFKYNSHEDFRVTEDKSLIEIYGSIRYRNQIAMVHPDNTITAYAFSAPDIMEPDWLILDN